MRFAPIIAVIAVTAWTLAACVREPTLTLKPDSKDALSGCLTYLSVTLDPPAPEGTTPEFAWFVDGKRVPDEKGAELAIARDVSERTTVTVTARYARPFTRAEASVDVAIDPIPFRDPTEGGIAFSKAPVIPRGENQYLDPGAMAWDGAKFRTVYNAIATQTSIYFGYAESDDGIHWRRHSGPDSPTIDRPAIALAIGVNPNNIHARTLMRDGDAWALYFTAANAGDFFFGNTFRARAADPRGPWKVDPVPCFPGSREAWFAGDRGLPQAFPGTNGGLMLFCATRAGGLVLAESAKDGEFGAPKPVLPSAFHPAIARTEWGWVMACEEKLYLSRDGSSWHRYKRDLFSKADLESRGIENIVITALVEHDGKYRYFVEGVAKSRSDVWLLSWGD